MFEHIIYKHTLEVIFPKQDLDELHKEFCEIVEQVQNRYDSSFWMNMNSNQSFYIWRDVAMWFAEKHWGVIVVEDWMEYHGWQYLPLYDREGNRVFPKYDEDGHMIPV